MQPRLIVVMGEHAADCIGIQYVHQKEDKRQEHLYRRRFEDRDIPMISIIHPSARPKSSLHKREGERIREALDAEVSAQINRHFTNANEDSS